MGVSVDQSQQHCRVMWEDTAFFFKVAEARIQSSGDGTQMPSSGLLETEVRAHIVMMSCMSMDGNLSTFNI